MGLNLSNEQIAAELGLSVGDVQAMTTQMREGIVEKKANPPERRDRNRRGVHHGWAQRSFRSGRCWNLIYSDEYDIYNCLTEWGYEHKSVNHSAGE